MSRPRGVRHVGNSALLSEVRPGASPLSRPPRQRAGKTRLTVA